MYCQHIPRPTCAPPSPPSRPVCSSLPRASKCWRQPCGTTDAVNNDDVSTGDQVWWNGANDVDTRTIISDAGFRFVTQQLVPRSGGFGVTWPAHPDRSLLLFVIGGDKTPGARDRSKRSVGGTGTVYGLERAVRCGLGLPRACVS